MKEEIIEKVSVLKVNECYSIDVSDDLNIPQIRVDITRLTQKTDRQFKTQVSLDDKLVIKRIS